MIQGGGSWASDGPAEERSLTERRRSERKTELAARGKQEQKTGELEKFSFYSNSV